MPLLTRIAAAKLARKLLKKGAALAATARATFGPKQMSALKRVLYVFHNLLILSIAISTSFIWACIFNLVLKYYNNEIALCFGLSWDNSSLTLLLLINILAIFTICCVVRHSINGFRVIYASDLPQ